LHGADATRQVKTVAATLLDKELSWL